MSTLNIDNIADVAGTGAPDFAAMPSVAGDPVVASGSNTDGEWVKWADGTQQVSGQASTNSTAESTWTYPAPFIAGPSGISGMPELTGRVVTTGDTVPTASSMTLRAYSASGGTRSSAFVKMLLTGRWK